MQKSNVIDNVDLEDLEFKLHDNYGEKVSGKHPKEATINAEFSNDNKIVIAQNQKL